MTQKELAEKLGIAQTTVANYESGIRFPDENILIKLSDFFNITVDWLIRKDNEHRGIINPEKVGFDYSPSRLNKDSDKFLSASLQSGNKATETALNLLKTGYTEEQILIDLFEPSLIKTGTFWAQGIYNEAMEHQISSAVLQAMAVMQAHAKKPMPFRGKAVCLTASGEGHNIGLKMISRFLEIDGWESFFLGTSIPADSLKDYIADMHIDLVLISVTLNENTNSCCSLIKAVKSIENPPTVIAGGAGIKQNRSSVIKAGADHIFQSVSETLHEARILNPI